MTNHRNRNENNCSSGDEVVRHMRDSDLLRRFDDIELPLGYCLLHALPLSDTKSKYVDQGCRSIMTCDVLKAAPALVVKTLNRVQYVRDSLESLLNFFLGDRFERSRFPVLYG